MDSSSVLSDEDYDVISNPGQKSLESSVADFSYVPSLTTNKTIHEPVPLAAAKERFNTVSLTAQDIQAYVRSRLSSSVGRSAQHSSEQYKTVRVYTDGLFDVFNAGHALQLRQAKLAFPSVYLMVGVFSDDQCRESGKSTLHPDFERAEVLRHCRWVDEVVPDAPWMLDDAFLVQRRIDYVALGEGSSLDLEFDNYRPRGLDGLQKSGRIIATQRTVGLTAVKLSEYLPVSSQDGSLFRLRLEEQADLEPTHSENVVVHSGC